MNILYLTCGRLHPTQGGTERTTITMAQALKKYHGAKIYSIYQRQTDVQMDDCLEEEFYWPIIRGHEKNIDFLRKIIVDNKINAVIIQGAFIHVKMIREAAEGLDCKIIFAHHFRPGFERTFHSFKNVLRNRERGFLNYLRWVRNIVMYPKMHRIYLSAIDHSYNEAYENADHVILLTKSFIRLFKAVGKIQSECKFVIIPNALSFDVFIKPEELVKKTHTVLIVARLDESAKRISTALRIWKQVKTFASAKDWILKIIGHGADSSMYQKMVKNERIPDVHFLGRQNPLPFYREASIFMMTSTSESWGLTLTEAQQMGCVPIAFDTYESLHKIIEDNYNGRIIPAGDIDSYIEALYELMTNPKKRELLARNGIQSSRQFAPEKIAESWWCLLTKEQSA